MNKQSNLNVLTLIVIESEIIETPPETLDLTFTSNKVGTPGSVLIQ
jgi:hypothetical protein